MFAMNRRLSAVCDVVALLAVWLSGNALASINVVALRQTRLVLGWVTVCGRANHFGRVRLAKVGQLSFKLNIKYCKTENELIFA